MNIFKSVRNLVLVLVSSFVSTNIAIAAIQSPVQTNVASAVEFGMRAGMAENQKDFTMPINGGGTVTVRIDPYEYGYVLNSLNFRYVATS
ncbi:MAG: hypothetical protein V1646_02325 [bacterium]